MNLGGHHWRRRVSPHATRIGALITVEQAFVVLAGGQGCHVFAITQDHETGLFTRQKLFDHHPGPTGVVGHTQGVVQQHEVNRFMGFGQGHGHNHTFTSGQAVSFDHNRRPLAVHIGMGQGRVGKSFKFGRRNAMPLHEGL